ncbi:MAG: hypothetical protein ABSF95_00575 [Verrucomicrobiota bacterium]|jgi:hypothetical protein
MKKRERFTADWDDDVDIRRTSGQASQDDEAARQRVAEILSCAGLSVASDSLAFCHTGDRLHIGFSGGALVDVNRSAGLIEL